MIQYEIGDATKPKAPGAKIIAHVCNDENRWGRGFVLALNQMSPKPKEMYHRWGRGEIEGAVFQLGNVQLVRLAEDLYVANCIAQHGIVPGPATHVRDPILQAMHAELEPVPGKEGLYYPVRYAAIRQCLQKVAQAARSKNATVCLPRIGSGLAGGLWWKVEDIIRETLIQAGIPVIVYDLSVKQRLEFSSPPHSRIPPEPTLGI